MTGEAGQGSRPVCPTCGEPHAPDQEYCLECGARVFPEHAPQTSSPLWAWVAVVALGLIAIVSGVVVAILATQDGSDDAAAPLVDEVVAPAAPAPAAPAPAPVVPEEPPVPTPPPPTTIVLGPDLPDEGGASTPQEPSLPGPGVEEDSFDTSPPDAGSTGTWPSGRSGFTVIVASVPTSRGRGAADVQAGRATAAGLGDVGVLDSSSFSSLRPGYWVVYTGTYDTLDRARANLPGARSAGFPSAYTRRVEP